LSFRYNGHDAPSYHNISNNAIGGYLFLWSGPFLGGDVKRHLTVVLHTSEASKCCRGYHILPPEKSKKIMQISGFTAGWYLHHCEECWSKQ